MGQLHGSKEIFLLLLLEQIVEDHDNDVDPSELCGRIGEEAEQRSLREREREREYIDLIGG